jgi:hypothetical protein
MKTIKKCTYAPGGREAERKFLAQVDAELSFENTKTKTHWPQQGDEGRTICKRNIKDVRLAKPGSGATCENCKPFNFLNTPEELQHFEEVKKWSAKLPKVGDLITEQIDVLDAEGQPSGKTVTKQFEIVMADTVDEAIGFDNIVKRPTVGQRQMLGWKTGDIVLKFHVREIKEAK